jgi:hypothetical protein
MSIEDRVRAATRARTDLVRDIRPLGLPDELPARGRRSRHARPARDPRRWLTWGAPIAAAALVTALALALVLLRQAPAPQPGPVAPTSAPPSPSAIPRYYVTLPNDRTSPGRRVIVGDDQTGRTFAFLNPALAGSFYGVTGAADDRTFVLANYEASTQESTWYLLRIAPGTAHPAQLTKLPIKPVLARVAGLALSPDGRELAVMWRNTPRANAVVSLGVYSMASGAVMHTWITRGDDINATSGGANNEALAWVDGDRSLDFRWAVYVGGFGNGTDMIRTIDVTAPGSDLLADSRVAVQAPFYVYTDKTLVKRPCPNDVTASDGTVVCGTSSSAPSFVEVCSTLPPSFVTYSGTTGKQLKVLYQWHGQCLYAVADPLWTDSAGRHVIASLALSEKGIKMSSTDEVGLIADGKFTSLPQLANVQGADFAPGGIAF